jgi:spore coat protein A, manganese oxidase
MNLGKLNWGSLILATLALMLLSMSIAPCYAQPPLIDPATVTDRYIDELPQPPIWGPVFGTSTFSDTYGPGFDMYEKEVQQVVHAGWPATSFFTYDTSPVPGVGATPAPTMVVASNQHIVVRFHNNLPANPLVGVDTTIMGADRGLSLTRTSIHVHGAHVEAASDGHPDSTFNPGSSRDYHYSNMQEAATLWYHDHTMGTTRINAYQGLAGFWLVVDPTWLGLLGNGLPDLAHLKGIAFQDREFMQADTQLWYPNPWVPEFFGRFPFINGKIFPKCTVDPAQYLFLMLGGSQARFWNMTTVECDSAGNTLPGPVPGPAWTVVADEQGLLAHPAVLNDPNDPNSPRFRIAPGERFQVVIDFSAWRGRYLKVINNNPTPYQNVTPPGFVSDVPDVMVFKVNDVAPLITPPVPANLRPVTPPVQGPNDLQRMVSLREYHDLMGNPTRMLVNGMHFYDPYTEIPRLGSTEVWGWVNTTMDVHPMHMHDVRFKILDRTPFDVQEYLNNGDIVYNGPTTLPDPYEDGWKDIALCPPGQVTRWIASFDDYTGAYMDHCHILDHEENEMMRPFLVMPSDWADVRLTLGAQPSVNGCDPFSIPRDTICVSAPRKGLPNLKLIIHLPHGMVLDGGPIVTPTTMPAEPGLILSMVQDLGGDSIELDVALSDSGTIGGTIYCLADIPIREESLLLGSFPLNNVQSEWVAASGQRFINELYVSGDTLVEVPPCSFVGGFDARPADASTWLAWNWTPDSVGAVAFAIVRSPMSGEYPLYPSRMWLDTLNYPHSSYPPAGWTQVVLQSAAGRWGQIVDASSYTGTNGRGQNIHFDNSMPMMGGNFQNYWLDGAASWTDANPASTFRDVYRYMCFTEDMDGNWSVLQPLVFPQDFANADFTTNYWLGDFVPEDAAGTAGSRGYVNSEDLGVFSASYFQNCPPAPGYLNIGPTAAENESFLIGRGTPMPDTHINFSDLVTFAFNYGNVAPVGVGMKQFMVQPPRNNAKDFASLDAVPKIEVSRTSLGNITPDNSFVLTVALAGNHNDAVKAVEAELTYDPDVMELISVDAPDVTVNGGAPFNAAQQITDRPNVIGMAAAACGPDAMIAGDAPIATITFRWKSNRVAEANVSLNSVKLADQSGAVVETQGNTLPLQAVGILPNEYALHQNYPNPFNPGTTIAYDLRDAGHVTIEVFNVLGEKVATLVNADMKAGRYTLNFNASNLASGVYVYKITANEFTSLKKMMLMR